MTAPCDHLLGLVGWESETELRPSNLAEQAELHRRRDQRWLDRALDPLLGNANPQAIQRVRDRLASNSLDLLHDDVHPYLFKHCPDCGAKLPPLQELLP